MSSIAALQTAHSGITSYTGPRTTRSNCRHAVARLVVPVVIGSRRDFPAYMRTETGVSFTAVRLHTSHLDPIVSSRGRAKFSRLVSGPRPTEYVKRNQIGLFFLGRTQIFSWSVTDSARVWSMVITQDNRGNHLPHMIARTVCCTGAYIFFTNGTSPYRR